LLIDWSYSIPLM